MKEGFFITFEGGEGCGKSTQAKLLYQYLDSKRIPAILTKEPGGNEIGESIRKILLDPDNKGKIDSIAELFLFEAARSQFMSQIVIPNLEKGVTVISDRFYDSSTAYQGYGRGLNVDMISYLNKIASKQKCPDLTFLIDISAETGLKKITTSEFGKADRMEQEGLSFHERVNDGFREIANLEKERIKIIPYLSGQINEMQEIIRHYFDKLMEK